MPTYHIEFDTEQVPGHITSTKVVISKAITSNKKDVFNVGLSDDPLYPHLVRYVQHNPIPKK